MDVVKPPAFTPVASTTSQAPASPVPRTRSPHSTHSALPNGSNQRSAGAPLSNLVHPHPLEPGSGRLDRTGPEGPPRNNTLRRKKAPAFRSAPPTMDGPELPSVHVSSALTASPLETANGDANVASTGGLAAPSSSRDAEPSMSPSQPPAANVPNSKIVRQDAVDGGSMESGVPSTESPFPTGDWPTETALAEPIPDWLPVAGAENPESVQEKKTQSSPDHASGRVQQIPPAAEKERTTFAVTFEAAPAEESAQDRLDRLSTDTAERAAALTACVPALDFRDQGVADDDRRPNEETSSPEPDVSLPLKHGSTVSRGSNPDKSDIRGKTVPVAKSIVRDSAPRVPGNGNGILSEPEVIVISDDDDEALPIRSNSRDEVDAPEVKQEPTTNQFENIQPEGDQRMVSQRDEGESEQTTAKRSGKRRRVNYPYTNSISMRNLQRELDFEVSDHSSDDEEDMSVDGDLDDDERNNGLADYSSSGDPDFVPNRTQALGASSGRRS